MKDPARFDTPMTDAPDSGPLVSSRDAVAYIDGHNFYHGCVKGAPEHKWLDLVAFSAAVLGRSGTLKAVRYYTARVVDRPEDPSQSQRQDVYLKALAASGVEIIEGHFVERIKRAKLKGSGELVQVVLMEEKGSDVNLGSDLVHDACTGVVELALVITNDVDQQRAITTAIACQTVVYTANPHRNQKQKLVASGTKNIRLHHLRDNQLPTLVEGQHGTGWTRPKSWTRADSPET